MSAESGHVHRWYVTTTKYGYFRPRVCEVCHLTESVDEE